MRSLLLLAVVGGLCWMTGCTIEPAQRPRVVHREVYYNEPAPPPDGPVVMQGDEPPPVRVEVVPARPYARAVWVRGHWERVGRHRYAWVRGHWD